MFSKLKTDYRAFKSAAFSSTAKARANMVLERIVHDTNFFGEYAPIINSIIAMVNQGQFEAAVSAIDKYTQLPFHAENGCPLYYQMAKCLVSIGETEPVATERLKLYQSWHTRRPACPYAAASLASAYQDMAWVYRGSGWASSVSEDGWEKFQHYSQMAKKTFDDSANFSQHWYWADKLQDYSLVDCQTAEHVLGRHDFVASIIPTVPNIYRTAAYALLPRWYGDYVELEKFIRRSADQTQHIFGDGLYAYINLAILYEYEELDDLHIDRARFSKGCQDWLLRFPSQYYRTHMISVCFTEGLYNTAYDLICGLTELHENAYYVDSEIHCVNAVCKEFYES